MPPTQKAPDSAGELMSSRAGNGDLLHEASLLGAELRKTESLAMLRGATTLNLNAVCVERP